MTPKQRVALARLLGHGNPAAPELVFHALDEANGARTARNPDQARMRNRAAADALPAVVRRLLDAEQQLATCRRILAEAVVLADDLPDDGLTAGDLLRLLAARGLDLRADIADAEQLRDAEQLAGAW